ncbi:hypothetical protein F2P81_018977 [Scophthalmus maximus]|uniref:Uncharacterized protein n=1 Tax=Scophthalmus maximus TaxID=52904 RepID=A0A6A4SHL5_SCOMX|nr:hypothetical protein F2P81_018977 [Scophthalmus maximus]
MCRTDEARTQSVYPLGMVSQWGAGPKGTSAAAAAAAGVVVVVEVNGGLSGFSRHRTDTHTSGDAGCSAAACVLVLTGKKAMKEWLIGKDKKNRNARK